MEHFSSVEHMTFLHQKSVFMVIQDFARTDLPPPPHTILQLVCICIVIVCTSFICAMCYNEYEMSVQKLITFYLVLDNRPKN